MAPWTFYGIYIQFLKSTLTSDELITVGFSRYLPIPNYPSVFWPHAYTSPSCVKNRVWYRPHAICLIFIWSNILILVSGTNICCSRRTSVRCSYYSVAPSGFSWCSRACYLSKAPRPSWPWSPEPQANTLSLSVANTECLEPAEISNTISF